MKQEYALIIIGGGAAGLSAAYLSRSMFAKTLLIEAEKTGGECLYSGCVPSKALLTYTKNTIKPVFVEARRYIQDAIKKIEPHDSVKRYRDMGADVVVGRAEILTRHSVKVGGRVYSGKNILIATGSKPFVPEIPGIENTGYYTSKTIWNMKTLPKTMGIIGGGAAACELAQGFSRLGVKISIIESKNRILPSEDPEASELVAREMQNQGIRIYTDTGIQNLLKKKNRIHIVFSAKAKPLEVEVLLVAAGKIPQRPESGVFLKTRNGWIETDEMMRTSQKNIFAAGDISGKKLLTNAAAKQATVAVLNALLPLARFRFRSREIPYAIFTQPEIAVTGRKKHEIRGGYTEKIFALENLGRGIIEKTPGYVRLLADKKGRILGATAVGKSAAEFMSELHLAMVNKIPLRKILSTSHIYPSMSEANVYTAGLFHKIPKNSFFGRLLNKITNW